MPGIETTKERDILFACKALLEFLKNRGVLDYFRITTSGILREGRYLVANKEMAGFSDIIILTPEPRTIFLELKAEKGRQSDNQKRFQKRVEAMGHKYYLCRSREALCQILEENSVPMKLFFK